MPAGFCLGKRSDLQRSIRWNCRTLPAKINDGEVSEWLMVPLSKSGLVMSQRGFESHPLRRTGRFKKAPGVHGRVA